MKPLFLLLAGGPMVLALGALAIWRGESVLDRADPENADQVARGRVVYAEHCASCHGDSLQGQPNWRERRPDGKLPAPPHDETGHTWHHPDEQLFRITKSGIAAFAPNYESDMPPFEGVLSDEEIWSVLAFIKSTWPLEIRKRQERRAQRAKQ